MIREIDPLEASELIEELDTYLQALYPAESNHLDSIETLRKQHVTMIGLFEGSQIVAIGAVKLMKGYGEIKRVYVPPSHRGKKLSNTIMEKLETHLLRSGIQVARLEIGINQPEALNLYKSRGYVEREPFGDYALDPLSIFMEKQLTGNQPLERKT